MTEKRSRPNGEGSIYPNRNGFAAYVWVTLPSGRRQRKYVYGPTRKVVHAKWVGLTQAARRGPVQSSIPTLGQYMTSWLEEVIRPNAAPLTYSTYATQFRLHIEPALGGIRLDRLRVRDIQTWLNGLSTRCQCCAQGKDARRAAKIPARARCCAKGECCRSVLAARSIRDVRTVLRSACSSAMRDEYLDKNLAALTRPPKSRARKVKAWSSEEARQFLESAKEDGDSLYAAFVLVLCLGMRKGEVLGLMWNVVDLDAGELTISLQLQRVRRELLLRETKTEASEGCCPIRSWSAWPSLSARLSKTGIALRWRRRGRARLLARAWCLPVAMGHRLILERSTDALMLAAPLPGCAVCGCTMPARPAQLCWSTSTFTHGSSCESFAMQTLQ
jgi:integrase